MGANLGMYNFLAPIIIGSGLVSSSLAIIIGSSIGGISVILIVVLALFILLYKLTRRRKLKANHSINNGSRYQAF